MRQSRWGLRDVIHIEAVTRKKDKQLKTKMSNSEKPLRSGILPLGHDLKQKSTIRNGTLGFSVLCFTLFFFCSNHNSKVYLERNLG
jgi:hypothetical protein